MKQYINLANPALLPPKPFFQFKTLLMALGAVVVLLLILSGVVRMGVSSYERVATQAAERVKVRQAQLQSQQALLTVREKAPQLAQDLARARAELQRLQQIAATLPAGSDRLQAATSLQALSAASMPGVWLAEISLQQGAVSLQGYALRAELIPEYLQRLQQQVVFKGQRFEAFELGRKVFDTPDSTTKPEAIAFQLLAAGSGGQP